MPQKNFFREVIHQLNSLSFTKGEFSQRRRDALPPASPKVPFTDPVTFFGHHLFDHIT